MNLWIRYESRRMRYHYYIESYGKFYRPRIRMLQRAKLADATVSDFKQSPRGISVGELNLPKK